MKNLCIISDNIAVAKAISTKPNTETLIPQSFPFCQVTEHVEVLPYALCLLLYIVENPWRWANDPENPQHYPENQEPLLDLPF